VNAENPEEQSVIDVEGLDLYYDSLQALKGIKMSIARNRVTAFIGPSGCGKSTLLRCFNRMNDLVPGVRTRGTIRLDGEDITAENYDVISLRRRVGMVFQKSNPFPMSIYENVVYGLKIAGVRDRRALAEACEKSLEAAALWEDVKDRLSESALSLSSGQMQRLCIARAIAVDPEVILMDEPCSALDPIATSRIERLVHQLKERFTVVIVTHNMQQASRVADYTAFMLMGELIELTETRQLFTNPRVPKTEDYITGRFG